MEAEGGRESQKGDKEFECFVSFSFQSRACSLAPCELGGWSTEGGAGRGWFSCERGGRRLGRDGMEEGG
jgi:hypothetical protein